MIMDTLRVLTSGPVYYFSLVSLVLMAAAMRRSLKARQCALLLASWLFYAGWGVAFLAVLLFSSVMNYCLGALLRKRVTATRLWLGIVANLALLALFKYGTGVFAAEAELGWMRDFVRPIGISFWTFQALSYLLDIYREEELDPSLLELCLYMAFAPTVLVGPICRLPALLPQLRQPIAPSATDISIGARRVLQGLCMKMVVAEILGAGWRPGTGVNAMFDRATVPLGGLDVWFLAIGFGLQLFFDFAGYSHVAIGSARLLGVRLDENFDRPYLSLTPAAFWTRWHMSLSSWIRDYLFLPLASMRRGRWWTYLSLLLSMIAVGLWHEAAATFIVWGAYHGLLLVGHRLGQQAKRALPYRPPSNVGPALSWTATFGFVCLGWLFFRAHTLTQAFTMFRAVLNPSSYQRMSLPVSYYVLTIVVVLGWVSIHAAATLWERWQAAHYRRAVAEASHPFSPAVAPTLNMMVFDLFEFTAARMWWWLAPIVIVIALFGGTAYNEVRPGLPKTPFMYTLF
jgi:alginate O-acetyltransferase complex protein AlgI